MSIRKRALSLLLVLVMLLGVLPAGAAAAEVYQDVPSGHWASDYIARVAEQGLMVGTSDTTFAPDETITRAMFVTILARYAKAETDNNAETAFTDVPAGQYYTGAVAWAAANGIVNGTSAVTFAPNDPVTREQMAALLYRAMRFLGNKCPQDGKLEVLDYERASHIIRTASHIGVSMCYCRHKMQHLGRACDAPMDICMTFNTSARSLIKYDHARQVDAAECLDLLAVAQGHNLVQFGENAREGVNFICNCCGCCCEALLAIKRFAIARTIHSNFIARAGNDCRGCGKCEKVCPVNAIHMEDGPAGKRFAFVDPERCIGCGVCVRSCAFGQLTLEARPERAITPLNTVNRVVAMAAERGMIKELLEDNDAMGNHRIMAAVIGAIMKLPGAPRALAVAQLKSRYLENLIGKMG